MNSTRFILSISAAVSLLLAPSFVRAESSVTQAFQVARGAVNQDVQNRVVSIYGTGSPDSIQKWYIIFYDPTIPSHGRAVLVQDGQIVKTYAANGGVVYRSDLTFDPARMTPEGPALAAAQDYASKHNLTFDSVRALLKQTPSRPFRWRIELMSANQSRGYVFINALDSSVAVLFPCRRRRGCRDNLRPECVLRQHDDNDRHHDADPASRQSPDRFQGSRHRREAHLPRHRRRLAGILHRRAHGGQGRRRKLGRG